MGADIHYTFQKKNVVDEREVWETIETDDSYGSKFHIGRHYLLFAALADVRNGFGFGGISTHEPIPYMALPKGIPDDMDIDEYGDSVSDNKWYGDHSYSYLSGDEILDYFKTPNITTRYGIISKNQYLEWDGKSSPTSWSGGVSASDISIYDASNEGAGVSLDDDVTNVRIKWECDVNKELGYFKSIIEHLTNEHGEVRMVFGFDS